MPPSCIPAAAPLPPQCRGCKVEALQPHSVFCPLQTLIFRVVPRKMVRCSAVGCSNYSGMGKILHRFPRDPERRKKWEEKVRRENWKPKDNSYLCSDHFEEMHYENKRVDNLKRLKASAVPTVFTATVATTPTTSKASQCTSKARSLSSIKSERRNASDDKNNARNASPTPHRVFTEHSYSNTISEARLGVASRSSEGVGGNEFQIDKVSQPDFTNGNGFLPSEPVPDFSFSSFPSSSSSFTYLSYSTSSSASSSKEEKVIVKREENSDINRGYSVSVTSSHYPFEEVVKEEMSVLSKDSVQEFPCRSNECKIPSYVIPQQGVTNVESLFSFVGIPSHDQVRLVTTELQVDPKSEDEREKSPFFVNDDNLRREKIPEQELQVITNDSKVSLNCGLPDSAIASWYTGEDEGKITIKSEEIEHNTDSNSDGAEAVNTAHTNYNLETEYHHENYKCFQDPDSKVASLTDFSASMSSFSCLDDKLLKLEQKMKQLEQALAKQRKKMHKIKEQRKRQENAFAKVFAKDQLANLGRKSKRGVKWSKETIRKALLLLSACRPLGYKALLLQNLPLPSLGLLRRLGKISYNRLRKSNNTRQIT